MRFSIAALFALAAGAVATDVVTETLTQYTTYCPEATSLVHNGQTYSISTPGHITLTNGPFTVTRPLVTQTVTQCSKCSSSTPIPTTPVAAVSPSARISTPLVIPSGAAATGSASGAAGAAGASAASQTPFNAGAVNAASAAGAGLAAVFGAAALLL